MFLPSGPSPSPIIHAAFATAITPSLSFSSSVSRSRGRRGAAESSVLLPIPTLQLEKKKKIEEMSAISSRFWSMSGFCSVFLLNVGWLSSFLLSNPLYSAYLLFFSPYLLRLLCFLSPLLLCISLLFFCFPETQLPAFEAPEETAFHTLQSSSELQVLSSEVGFLQIFSTELHFCDPVTVKEELTAGVSYSKGEEDARSPACISKEIDPNSLETGNPPKIAERGDPFAGFAERDSRARKKSELLVFSPERRAPIRREKEWRRTLACKLYEERRSAGESGEGMDSLWEVPEADFEKGKTKDSRERVAEIGVGGRVGEEEEEEEMRGEVCCLQALKLTTGKMNLGMRRPSLQKLSKKLKAMGLFVKKERRVC